MFVVSIVAAVGTLWWRLDAIDSWLANRTKNRVLFAIAFSLIVPAITAISVDVADFSKVLEIKGIPADQGFSICVTVLFGVTYAWGQVVLMLHSDAWNKRLDAATKQKEEALLTTKEHKNSRDFVLRLDAAMLQFVGAKKDRAFTVNIEDTPIEAGNFVQKVTCPEEQIKLLCDVVRELLNHELASTNGHSTMRVACFRSEDQHLRPVYSYDGVSRDFLRNVYAGYAEHFDLAGAAKTSLAVAAARQHRIMIVPDTKSANDDSNSPFWFFGPTQRDTLQSVLAIPISCMDDSEHALYVICFDTSVSGFFSESRREQYDLIQRNIEPRLLYETYTMRIDKKSSQGRSSDYVAK